MHGSAGKHWKVKDVSRIIVGNREKNLCKLKSEETKKKFRERHWSRNENLREKTLQKIKENRRYFSGNKNPMFGRTRADTSERNKKMWKEGKLIVPIKNTSIELKIQNFLTLLHIEFFTHKYMNILQGYRCDIIIPKQETGGFIILQNIQSSMEIMFSSII